MQILINIILSFSNLVLLALSFSLIYKVTHFFHFALGAIFTLGPYFTFLFRVKFNFSFILAVFTAIILCAFTGYFLDRVIYKNLRKKNATPMISLIASIGIYIIIQNLISIFFGDSTETIREWPVREGLNLFGGRITIVQIFIINISLLLVVLIVITLNKSNMGRNFKAISNDRELADISGINSDFVILLTFIVTSALAGISGILFAIDMDINPSMGMNFLIMGIVAVLIGGKKSFWGVVVGSILIAFLKNIGGWIISFHWQDAICLGVLFAFLIMNPDGFQKKKQKMRNFRVSFK